LLNFKEKLNILKENPFNNSLDIKNLKWLESNYRLRIWKYRFLYLIENNELIIYFYKAWSRWGVYK
jgi:mRNA interferase RelE/StbE